jgi:hypothetical protein
VSHLYEQSLEDCKREDVASGVMKARSRYLEVSGMSLVLVCSDGAESNDMQRCTIKNLL